MTRTHQQNKYYWKCIVKLLCDHTGYHKYEMHEQLKNMFIPDRSNNLTTKDFTQYCDEIRVWAQQELNVILPQPNEY